MTPPHVLAALGPFDLDPCAAPEPRPWPTATHHFVEAPGEDGDGLAREWFGRVFLNPPYARSVIGNWMAKMAAHGRGGGRGIALVFARTDTAWFQRDVFGGADAALFLEGRLYFHHPDGRRARANAGAASVLAAYGRNDADLLACCGLAGRFAPITLPRFVPALLRRRTWREAVSEWMALQDGPATIEALYRALAGTATARRNRHARAKIRQTLQRGPFERLGRGLWRLEGTPCS
nr:phage N-6-adenine-methyltransferase [Afifella sp. IM 167]